MLLPTGCVAAEPLLPGLHPLDSVACLPTHHLPAGQGRASQFLSATVPEEQGTALNGGRTYREPCFAAAS